jgi:hypothetical protein
MLQIIDKNGFGAFSEVTSSLGKVRGYSSAGYTSSLSSTASVRILNFSTNSYSGQLPNLTQARYQAAGQSSTDSGYTSGGVAPIQNVIDKFPFATNLNATDVGDLSQARYGAAGQNSLSNGYTSGGQASPIVPNTYDTIDKFPFASDTNATDVGNLTGVRVKLAGQSSITSGYTSGGASSPSTILNNIDKFPFASDSNSTDVGDLIAAKVTVVGQNSLQHGYTSGGYSSPPFIVLNVIEKFSFSADSNSTDVGDLSTARYSAAGFSSTSEGYISNGFNPPTYLSSIEKFSFSNDSNASIISGVNLDSKRESTGQQY